MPTMKTVVITPDTSSSVALSNLVCDCDWTERAFDSLAMGLAKQHIQSQHGNGIVKMNGVNTLVQRTTQERNSMSDTTPQDSPPVEVSPEEPIEVTPEAPQVEDTPEETSDEEAPEEDTPDNEEE